MADGHLATRSVGMCHVREQREGERKEDYMPRGQEIRRVI
jgi:hypothetical protein